MLAAWDVQTLNLILNSAANRPEVLGKPGHTQGVRVSASAICLTVRLIQLNIFICVLQQRMELRERLLL